MRGVGGNLFSYRSTKCVVGFFGGENLGEGGFGGGTYRRTVCPNAEMGWIGSSPPMLLVAPKRYKRRIKINRFWRIRCKLVVDKLWFPSFSLFFFFEKVYFSGNLLLFQFYWWNRSRLVRDWWKRSGVGGGDDGKDRGGRNRKDLSTQM